MSKKTVIFVAIAFILMFALAIGAVVLLFNGTGEIPSNVDVTTPSIYNEFEEDLTVPIENLQEQLSEIDKTGFDSQTLYWINKLREVLPSDTSLEEQLNDEQTIEKLCKEYFPEEYKAYKQAFLLGDDTKAEYPEDKNYDLYLNLLRMAETGDYQGVIRHVDRLLNEYKFTLPYNYNIGNVYRDSITLSNFYEMSDASKIKAIGNLSDPAMQLIATVHENSKSQCTMIVSDNSLYFKDKTRIEIQDMETVLIPWDTKDYHGILMNRYFNADNQNLEVVKIRFKINYDLSGYTPNYFYPHFNLSDENKWVVKDENGNVICDLTTFDETTLETWILEHPAYSDQARNVYNNMTSENSSEGDTEMDIDNSFMYRPVENVEDYDYEKYELFQDVIYEAYIPIMEIVAGSFNRLYLIQQVSNPEMNYFDDISHYISTYASNVEIQKFLRDNEWLYWNKDYFIDDEEGLMEGEVPETTAPVVEEIIPEETVEIVQSDETSDE